MSTRTQKVGVCSSSFSANKILRDELLEIFPSAYFNDTGRRLEDNELIDFLHNKEMAIVALEKINFKITAQLPNLKHVSKYGVGLDNIDIKALKEKGISLSWTGGVNKRSVSELALFFSLSLIRQSFNSALLLRQEKWHKGTGNTLSGKKFGIIGLGCVGLDLSQLLLPMGCEIWGNDILDPSHYKNYSHIKLKSQNEIFKSCDIVSLHTPLTKETENLINFKNLKKMKKGSYLINTARGELVNEEDLIKALDLEIIAGAAFDVFHGEPNISSKIATHSKIICTPHIGGSTEEAILAMGRSAIEGLLKPNYKI